MNLTRRRWLAALPAWAGLVPCAQAAAPALMLADTWRPGMPLAGYWVSEKYDGLRGWWDGRQLWTRGGERVFAPAWFTAGWPAQPMDGGTGGGRGRLEVTAPTRPSQVPGEKAWPKVRFMVFDLPAQPGDFDARLAALRQLLPLPAVPWLVAVPQQRATTERDLQALLDKTVRLGGEGLMLHLGSAPYRSGRSADLLKVKPHDDAEAVVVGHLPGQGRHAGRLGALRVRTPEGRLLRIGSGFTDAQRQNPPPIGSTITYRYNGLSAQGVPRFARFLRVRDGA